MALGAARLDVVLMVMREALTLVAAGVVLLFNLTPTDPVTLVMATTILIAVASFRGLPARTPCVTN